MTDPRCAMFAVRMTDDFSTYKATARARLIDGRGDVLAAVRAVPQPHFTYIDATDAQLERTWAIELRDDVGGLCDSFATPLGEALNRAMERRPERTTP